MKRILFVVNDSWFFVSHRLPLAEAAIKAGYEVHVAAIPDHRTQNIIDAGAIFHPWQLSARGLNVFGELKSIFALMHLIRTIKPDLLHLVTIKSVLFGGILSRLLRVPAVVFAISGMGFIFAGERRSHAPLRRLARVLYRVAMGHPNKCVIVQNSSDRDHFIRSKLASADQLVMMPGSGVDLTHFSYVPPPTDKPITVMLASRLLRDKGVELFVQASEALQQKHNHCRFVLVGSIDEKDQRYVTKAELDQWQSMQIVEWWGQRDDMVDCIAQCHIFCLPTTYGEGLPKVLIEAGAVGRPSVVSQWPGCAEIIKQDVNGLLVKPQELNALVSALNRLIEDESLRQKLGQRARAIVEDGFSVTFVAKKTLTVYDTLLDNH